MHRQNPGNEFRLLAQFLRAPRPRLDTAYVLIMDDGGFSLSAELAYVVYRDSVIELPFPSRNPMRDSNGSVRKGCFIGPLSLPPSSPRRFHIVIAYYVFYGVLRRFIMSRDSPGRSSSASRLEKVGSRGSSARAARRSRAHPHRIIITWRGHRASYPHALTHARTRKHVPPYRSVCVRTTRFARLI